MFTFSVYSSSITFSNNSVFFLLSDKGDKEKSFNTLDAAFAGFKFLAQFILQCTLFHLHNASIELHFRECTKSTQDLR